MHIPGLPTLAEIRVYVAEAMEAASAVCRFSVEVLLKSALAESAELQKVVPSYSHIVDDKKFDKVGAKKYLLGFEGRDALSLKSTSTHSLMKEIGRVHKAWGLQPEIENDEQFRDDYKHIFGIYTSAKKALTVIAATKTVTVLTGKDQKTNAAFLHTKMESDLPKALHTALSKLI